MKCEVFANAINIYVANHTYDGRSKFEHNEQPRTKPGNTGNREQYNNGERCSSSSNANQVQ